MLGVGPLAVVGFLLTAILTLTATLAHVLPPGRAKINRYVNPSNSSGQMEPEGNGVWEMLHPAPYHCGMTWARALG